jgi:hypothetical protein
MQLSAPILPLDPAANLSSDVAGFPTACGKGDSSSFEERDFGAILSAESRGARTNSDAPRSPASTTRAVPQETSTEENDAGGFSTGSHSRRPYFARKGGPELSDPTSDNLVVVAGVAVLPAPVVAAPVIVDAEINLLLMGGTAPTDAGVADTDSRTEVAPAPAVRVIPGRPFVGEMLSRQVAGGHSRVWIKHQSARGADQCTDGARVSGSARANGVGKHCFNGSFTNLHNRSSHGRGIYPGRYGCCSSVGPKRSHQCRQCRFVREFDG